MIRIADAVGRLVKCPDPGCGRPALVGPSRAPGGRVGGVPGAPGAWPVPENLAGGGANPALGMVDTRPLWFLLNCPRTGHKLFFHNTPVELATDG